MGRPERRLDPDGGPVERFALELRRLRESAGKPSYRELSRRAHYSVTALSEAAGGESLPSLPVTLAYAQACGADRSLWEARWRSVAEEVAAAEIEDDGEAEVPYRGLETFGSEDAGWFFGRERLVEELAGRLRRSSFLAVFGPSGSGKSSVLRAGLVPALGAGIVSGSQDWPTVVFTPGEHPRTELAVGLAGIAGVSARALRDDLVAEPGSVELVVRQASVGRSRAASVVVVVDQFEEVFTVCRDEEERRCFIDCLLRAADSRARIVVGMRADFYAHCAEHPGLVEALDGQQVLVGPMDEDDLRQVITGPAARAELRVETALVEAIVHDALGEPGALPLVSHALLETWKRRRGSTLTLAGYRDAGGIRGGIAQTAERLYDELDANKRRIVKQLFLRLTALGDGTDDTRRRLRRAELAADPGVAAVLDRLAAARLVTLDQDDVQVAHEAVIRHWPRLRGWLTEDRDLLQAHRRLTEAAAEWDQHGRDEGLLYRSARLAAWDTYDRDRLNELEHAFLAAGHDREDRERASRRRRTRHLVIGLIVVVVVMSLLAAVAFVQSHRAGEERDQAVSRQLAASARGQLQLDPELALLLAREAYAKRPTRQAEDVLRQAVVDARLRRTLALQQSGQVCGVSFSQDGRWLATTSGDGTLRVWDRSRGGLPVELHGHDRPTWTPVFSPDARHLATASNDGTARVWDRTGRSEPVVLRGHRGEVWGVAFSPDGRRLATADGGGLVRVWDWLNPAADPIVFRGHRERALSVAFSPDGRSLAASGGDGTVRIWDLASRAELRVLRGHENSVESIAYSPDGRTLATASTDGTLRLWDPQGHRDPIVLRGHDGTVEGVAFSSDGRRVASTGNDGTVRIWSATSAVDPLVLRGHRGTVWAAAFTPDGRRLASAGDDGTARIWDIVGSGEPMMLRGHQGPVWDAATAQTGTTVASAGQDGTVQIWKAGVPTATLRGDGGEVLGTALSPDGRQVASAERVGAVRVWNADGSGRPKVMRGHRGPVWTVAFTPDGNRVVSSGSDGTARIWDLAGRAAPIVLHGHQGPLHAAAVSPDNRRVAGAGEDGTVFIWNADGTGRPIELRGHEGMVWAVAFDPTGRRFASAGNDGTIRIRNSDGTGDPIVLRGHQGIAWGVAFSPDGRLLATTGNDNTVRIWSVTGDGDPLVFRGHGTTVESVEFASNGKLLTTHGDGTVQFWSCQACGPIQQVLALAEQHTTRSLTAEERKTYINPA